MQTVVTVVFAPNRKGLITKTKSDIVWTLNHPSLLMIGWLAGARSTILAVSKVWHLIWLVAATLAI